MEGGTHMRYSKVMHKIPAQPIDEALRLRPEQVIMQAEQDFARKVQWVCEQLREREAHILLLTGPSASGKTTTARRIGQVLAEQGEKVIQISLDNFFLPLERLPLWEDGSRNYESVESLDLECFRQVTRTLLETGRAELPLYDFTVNQRAAQGLEICYDQHTYLIIEGIHALNPRIAEAMGAHRYLRLYISVHSDFVDEAQQVLLPARDLRLTRRMLRDIVYRATTVERTLQMWDYVLRGEELYIQPFRGLADLHLDSTHCYEPALYRDHILDALQGSGDTPAHTQTVERLRREIAGFGSIPYRLIPEDSLIQEFISREHDTGEE